jgi:hypothetical protein
VTRPPAARCPGDIDVRLSTVPSSIVPDADGVDVTLTSTVDGSTTTERFDLLLRSGVE